MKNTLILSLCLGLLLGCSDELAPTAALSDADMETVADVETVFASKKAKMIPHKGVAYVHPVLVEPTDDPQVLHIFYEGDGNATHFGHYTETGDYYLHTDPEGKPLFIDNASITITVANGDQLFIDDLTAVAILSDDEDVPPLFDGEYTYAWGTGRFDGVSGHLHFQAQGGVSHYKGTISTVGSN